MNRVRKSNYELMRIILMFMILFWHVINNIVFYHRIAPISNIFWMLLHFLLIVHIDTFVMLTGYFQCDKENISIKKLLKINNKAYFYKIVFLIIFLSFTIVKLTELEILRLIQPITLISQYWYIVIYLLLYIISPFLNKLIKNIDKKTFRKMILTTFLISSILPTITNEMIFSNNRGYSLLNFVLLYFIGAYLRKYPIQKSYIFKNFTPTFKRLLYVIAFVFLAVLNLLIHYFGLSLKEIDNPIILELSSIILNTKIAYNNPIMIIQAVCFFLYFSEIKVKSRIIDFVAFYTLDVYLIHDNILLRNTIYTFIQRYLDQYSLGMKFFLESFIACIVIFILCILIGFIVDILFKLIYKIPLINKIKENMRKKIDSLGFDISW